MPWKDPKVVKQKGHDRYLRNREKFIAEAKQHYEKNKEEISKRRKELINYKERYRKCREAYLRDHQKYTRSEKGKTTRRRWQRTIYHTNPEFQLKKKARDIAKELPYKLSCEICGSTEHLEHHHQDYSKPREVQTLCYICHGKIHGVEKGF